MYQLSEKIQEPSGKWRVRVIVSEGEAMMLWFDTDPDQELVDAIIDNQLRQRAITSPVIEVQELACSAWQFRRALTATGLRDVVEAAVAAAGQDVKDGWEYTSEFHRYAPLVVQFGYALGQTDADLDNLFSLARSL